MRVRLRDTNGLAERLTQDSKQSLNLHAAPCCWLPQDALTVKLCTKSSDSIVFKGGT